METLRAIMSYAHFFEGYISVAEILDIPIPFLNDLIDAQVYVRKERAKAEEDAYKESRRQAQANSQSTRKSSK